MKTWAVRCGPPPPDHSQHLPAAAEAPRPRRAGARSLSAADKAQLAKLDAAMAQMEQNTARMQAALAKMAPTEAPLPGLTMKKDDTTCTPDSVAALRNAAKASEAWADDNAAMHWLRDTGPGDLAPVDMAGAFKMLNAGQLGGALGPGDASLGGTDNPSTTARAPSGGCGGMVSLSDPDAVSC
jgi:hypothetical protein